MGKLLLILLCICLFLQCYSNDNLISSRRTNENNMHIILDENCPLDDCIEEGDKCVQLFNMINEYRKQNGLNALVWNDELSNAAKIRATESVTCWSHNRPNGTEYWTVNPSIVYGENLARGFNTPQDILIGWKNSETHNANLLCSDFQYVGISYCGSNFAVEFCY